MGEVGGGGWEALTYIDGVGVGGHLPPVYLLFDAIYWFSFIELLQDSP